MGDVAVAAGIMGGLGLFFGALLAFSYRMLRVDEDPRIEMVQSMLPGSNCGACGEPGCAGFATAVVTIGRAPTGCTVASKEQIEAIADALGVDAGEQEKRVARLRCAGDRGHSQQIAHYEGYSSCRAAALAGGGKGCSWGCLGLADCEVACTFDAIQMSTDGLPVVDPDLCTACGDCVDACPKKLFEILPLSHKLYVQCNAPLAGDEARALCNVACDACGRCAQDAPVNLIAMRNNLPVIQYDQGGPATSAAILRCPTGAITWLSSGRQFEGHPLREKA